MLNACVFELENMIKTLIYFNDRSTNKRASDLGIVGIRQYLIAKIAIVLTKKDPIGASLLKISLCSKDELSLMGFRTSHIKNVLVVLYYVIYNESEAVKKVISLEQCV